MEILGQNIHFHPKNTLVAIFYFFFGTFFVWWMSDKISVFTGVFTNTFPKVIVWITFLSLFIIWLFVIPFLVVSGRTITINQFLQTFVFGFMGLISIIVVLPIMSVFIDAVSGFFDAPIVTAISWFVVLIIVLYTALYKPFEVLFND